MILKVALAHGLGYFFVGNAVPDPIGGYHYEMGFVGGVDSVLVDFRFIGHPNRLSD